MAIPEPGDRAFCVWYNAGVPFAVMVRLDIYEEDEALGERWFSADQYFTDNMSGYTWEQALAMLAHLQGPFLLTEAQYIGEYIGGPNA